METVLRRLCGLSAAAAVSALVAGCGGGGNDEMPSKQYAPPQGKPVPMKMPVAPTPPKSE